MGISSNAEIGAVEPERIAEFAAEHRQPADVLFISCTNFRALEARGAIERELGVPVLTSNQAALEDLM